MYVDKIGGSEVTANLTEKCPEIESENDWKTRSILQQTRCTSPNVFAYGYTIRLYVYLFYKSYRYIHLGTPLPLVGNELYFYCGVLGARMSVCGVCNYNLSQ